MQFTGLHDNRVQNGHSLLKVRRLVNFNGYYFGVKLDNSNLCYSYYFTNTLKRGTAQ